MTKRAESLVYAFLNTWGEILYVGTRDECKSWYDSQSNRRPLISGFIRYDYHDPTAPMRERAPYERGGSI